MKYRFYLRFCELVAETLEIDGCKVERNPNYIKIFQGEEIIYIPLFLIEYIKILYTKNNKVVDTFEIRNKYCINAARIFLRYNNKRNLRKALENDSETRF